MAKEKETVVETAQNAEQTQNETNIEETTPTQEEIETADVPEGADEISQEEALNAATDEIKRLTEALNAVKHQFEQATEQIAALEKTKAEFETKLAEQVKTGNNAAYIELLDRFEAKIEEYAGLRRERLRKEFITDLKEEIQKQKDLLTNA